MKYLNIIIQIIYNLIHLNIDIFVAFLNPFKGYSRPLGYPFLKPMCICIFCSPAHFLQELLVCEQFNLPAFHTRRPIPVPISIFIFNFFRTLLPTPTPTPRRFSHVFRRAFLSLSRWGSGPVFAYVNRNVWRPEWGRMCPYIYGNYFAAFFSPSFISLAFFACVTRLCLTLNGG